MHVQNPITPAIKNQGSKIVDFSSGGHGLVRGQDTAGGVTPISSPPQVVNFGIDTLYLNFDAIIPDFLLSAMGDLKKSIQTGTDEQSHFKFGMSDIFSWNLQRQGIRFYQFILKTGDISLGISTRRAGSPIANMFLQIGSISCQDDLKNVLRQFYRWAKRYNIFINSEKVSRIDLAADIAIPIEETGVENKLTRICRSGQAAYYESDYKLSGFSIGRGAIMMRAYDKILEMDVKQQDYKSEFFQKKWGNVDCLTRVEFQLRREVIKEMFPEKSNFAYLNERVKDIWKYCTHEWFRSCAQPVDRINKNQSHAKLSKFWSLVQKASGSLYKSFGVVRNRKQKHINIPALARQAVGCLLSAVAGTGVICDNRFQMYETIHDMMIEFFRVLTEKPAFEKKYQIKQDTAIVSF